MIVRRAEVTLCCKGRLPATRMCPLLAETLQKCLFWARAARGSLGRACLLPRWIWREFWRDRRCHRPCMHRGRRSPTCWSRRFARSCGTSLAPRSCGSCVCMHGLCVCVCICMCVYICMLCQSVIHTPLPIHSHAKRLTSPSVYHGPDTYIIYIYIHKRIHIRIHMHVKTTHLSVCLLGALFTGPLSAATLVNPAFLLPTSAL